MCKVVQKYNVDHAFLFPLTRLWDPQISWELQRIAELIFQGLVLKFQKQNFVSLDLAMFLDHLDQLFLSFVIKLIGDLNNNSSRNNKILYDSKEATLLVIHSLSLSEGGYFVVRYGYSIKIKDLAMKMIRLSGLTIKDKIILMEILR